MEVTTKKRISLLPIVFGTFVTVIASAVLGILRGPALGGGEFGVYTNPMIFRDTLSAIGSAALAYGFVKANACAVEKGYLKPRDSRKIIHTLSAPLFIFCWPVFSQASGAKFFASIVSFVNIIRLYLAGMGYNKSLANAISRSGDMKEALGGPFIYVLILQATILLFWRTSPVGVIAISTLAAGDGLADLLGRRYGENNKWFFNENKSIVGTTAFWIGATSCSVALLNWLQFTGAISQSAINIHDPIAIVQIASITAISAIVELIPGVDDNIVVPLCAATLSFILFH